MGMHEARSSNAKRATRAAGHRAVSSVNDDLPAAVLPPLEANRDVIPPTGILAGDDDCPVIHADSVNFGFSLGGRLRVIFYGDQRGRS